MEEKRRNWRFGGRGAWSEAVRERHRDERDRLIEQAGLVTDRLLDAASDRAPGGAVAGSRGPRPA